MPANVKINEELQRERDKCSFNVEELTNYLDGGRVYTQRRRDMEDKIFSIKGLMDEALEEYLSPKERYENAVRKAVLLYRALKELEDPMQSTMDRYREHFRNQIAAAVFKDVSPFGLHYSMFIPTLIGQADKEQQDIWLKRAENLEILGTYAQTEMGHGTFIRGLETTATYDIDTEEFILNSPTLTSYKWWPGNLGQTSNYCVVVAQLYIKGKNYGIQPFIVQIRDEDTHMPMPGIKVGEIGPKLGFNTVNNGFLGFTQHRIPRRNMLMKNAQVLKDGTYKASPNSKLAYGTMVFVRVLIINDSANKLSRAAAIAVRYSAIRKQSQLKADEPEIQVLDFVTQQHKLFIGIATSHAYWATVKWLWKLYMDITSDVSSGNLDRLPELHGLSCVLKAISSADCAMLIERCRQSCGGHGFLASSNLPQLYGIATAACTYEGENTVLFLQSARSLAKSFNQALKGEKLSPTTEYIADQKPMQRWDNVVEGIVKGSQKVAAGEHFRNQIAAAVFKDVSPFGLHYSMFIPTLIGQADKEQQDIWLKRAENLEILGTYAQTEMGHGTFIRGLETTATYDIDTEEFILNSPTLTSYKWWPGNLGQTSNYCVVVAQLYIKGKNYGIQPFIVQIRDEDTHMPMPGIKVGEIGPKLGFNTVNNGFLGFTQHRIPRRNMLMKNAQVLKDGTYKASPNSKLAYGTMVFVRVLIINDSANKLSRAAAIAVRYSAIRKQSQLKADEPEIQVLDFVTQQHKLFIGIATSHAYWATVKWLWKLYMDITSDVSSGNLDRLPELHGLSCVLKAISSADCAMLIERCRQSCGGHGFLASSNLPQLYGIATAACTYEGENTVLFLQSARSLAKSFNQALKGEKLSPTTEYIADQKPMQRWDNVVEGIVKGSQKVAAGEHFRNQIAAAVFKDVSPFGLHYSMFIPTLIGQADKEQQDIWLKRAENLEILGTYAQTEMGHGTFIRGLETTATYDIDTEEFILNSPTLTSYKWWPGNLGQTSNYCVVVAQLYIKGKNYGIQPFIVQIRDEDTHMPMPGIKVGEIGPKLGFNTVNNGFLGFTQHRIPRRNMLMKNAQVLKDGTYKASPNSKLAYGTMVFVRVLIINDSANKLSRAAAIAVRYSAIRKQSQLKADEPEIQVLDFVTQQHKLFIGIATSHAYWATVKWLWKLYMDITSDVSSGNLDRLPELHGLSCVLKAISSADCAMLIERCRQSCGGHGFLASSNLPQLYGIATAACTYEGENTVLFLQSARSLAKSFNQALKGEKLSPTTEYIADQKPMQRWDNVVEGIVKGSQKVAAGFYTPITQQDVQIIQRKYEDVLEAIRPNAVGLVDAFDYRDEVLNSTLGAYDGRVYERLMEEALKSPLNQEPVNQSYHKYIKPFLKKSRL